MENKTDKIRVAVLFGGRSAEHEVSLMSASSVIENIDTNLFEVIPIGIDKEGNWFLGNDVFAKSIEHKKVIPPLIENQSLTWFTPAWVGTPVNKTMQNFHELSVQHKGALFDVVFPVMHGTFCEDGSLQGLLELANIPYVGANVLSSAIGMDKDVAKRLAQAAGIKIAPYVSIKKNAWIYNQKQIMEDITHKLDIFPLFVKPANAGSSIGISKVRSRDELAEKIDLAFRFDNKVLVEKGLDAFELEVAVLESLDADQDPIVSVVGEIKTKHDFYSYQAKYLDENGATLIIPAPINEQVKLKAQQMAHKLFKLLECEGMARVDLFLDKTTNEVYFNEINTLPGFTQMSMYPKLMEASGITYPNLLKILIELALKKHKNKTNLIRSYEEVVEHT